MAKGVYQDALTQELPAALPLGRRSPRGHLRWYLAACPQGREASTCQKVRQIIPQDLLEDAFVPRIERAQKSGGQWKTLVKDLFKGYFIVATKDAVQLSRALEKLTFPVQLAGVVGRGYAPIDKSAQEFLTSCMDKSHVIRSSEGEIVSDQLHVLWGPLKGQESRVARVARHKRLASVRVGGSESGFTLAMPLEIPVRR